MHKSLNNKKIKRYSLYIIPAVIIVILLLLLPEIGSPYTYNINNRDIKANISPVAKNMSKNIILNSHGYSKKIVNGKEVLNVFVNITVLKLPEGMKMGNSITLNNNYSSSKVTVSGNKINLTITSNVGKSNKIMSHNNRINNINYSPDTSSAMCTHTYWKYPQNYKAALVVTKVSVEPLNVYSIAVIVGMMGNIAYSDVSIAGEAVGALAAVSAGAGIILGALAADYIALYTYASSNHYPTIYIDFGASIGTQWRNFYALGVYVEEGVFTGNYDSGNGEYMPIVSTSQSLYANTPHSSPWNPFGEPPW